MDRTVRGELNARRDDGAHVVLLEMKSHRTIIGFYWARGRRDGVMDLGSSLGQECLKGVLDPVFELPGCKNTVGMEETGRTDGDEEHHENKGEGVADGDD